MYMVRSKTQKAAFAPAIGTKAATLLRYHPISPHQGDAPQWCTTRYTCRDHGRRPSLLLCYTYSESTTVQFALVSPFTGTSITALHHPQLSTDPQPPATTLTQRFCGYVHYSTMYCGCQGVFEKIRTLSRKRSPFQGLQIHLLEFRCHGGFDDVAQVGDGHADAVGTGGGSQQGDVQNLGTATFGNDRFPVHLDQL